MEKFAEKLKEIMRLRGINQSELAAKIGIPQSSVSGWMRKDKRGKYPSLKYMIKLTQILRVTLEELTGLESLRDIEKEAEKIDEISPEEEALLKAYDELPDDDPRKLAIDQLLLLGAKKKPRNKK